jgi:hydroxymethylglutaryl-CoA synthase
MIDKSKSCKSVLMQLFEPSGNTNIEGVDTVNACYGGTNALFNTINWVESSAWDGRDAIVVAGDIALYDIVASRPTGGAGCVAMLVGPDAPLVFNPGLRGSFMKHAYDFYKPNLKCEYPIVDGHFSTKCYLEAVDACYKSYHTRKAAWEKLQNGSENETHEVDASKTALDGFDHIVFHAPNCKLVAKSYARMLYNDYLAAPEHQSFRSVPAEYREMDYATSLTDKTLEKTFMGLSKKRFEQRVQPSILAPTMCGNMYTASVYSALVSLVSNVKSEQLQGKTVGIFSYGSGLASTLFSLKVKGDVSNIAEKIDLHARLDARITLSPETYDEVCLIGARQIWNERLI